MSDVKKFVGEATRDSAVMEEGARGLAEHLSDPTVVGVCSILMYADGTSAVHNMGSISFAQVFNATSFLLAHLKQASDARMGGGDGC